MASRPEYSQTFATLLKVVNRGIFASPWRCLHTEHVKGLASYKLTQARHFGWVRSWLRQKRLKSGFLSAQGHEQRNDGSQALEALLPPSASHTNTSLVTNFLPVNPFKTSFLFLPFPEQGLYAHDFPMLGRSPCAQGPRQQARVICSPTSWQERRLQAVLVPTTMNAPPKPPS